MGLSVIEEERFWAKVDKSGDCWLWTASCTRDGYGQFRVPSLGKIQRAHRVAYALLVEHTEYDLDHTCHTRACVNPAHLRPVTNKQNHENLGALASSNSSGYRGVHWDSYAGRWRGRVVHHGKKHCAGYYATAQEAHKAVVAKRNELFTHNDADQ